MIFQDFKLLNDRTVLENVALPLRISGYSSSEIYDRVEDTLSKVGLSNLYNSYPLELSGGEQQRVCIARALVKSPKIILADEPTGNLDSKSGIEILNFFDELHKAGNTLIIVTHEESIARRAKRRVELFDGKIVVDE